MAVSDLTGTKWKIDSTTCTAGYGRFSINYICPYDAGGQSELAIGYYFEPPRTWLPTSDTIQTVPGLYNLQVNDEITISDGVDVTNATLIAWLEANATQVIAGNTYSLSNSLSNASAEDITFIIQPDEGYALPDTVTVTNGTLVSYNKATGEVVVSGASAEISVECEAVAPSGYSLTITFSNGNMDVGADVKINGNATVADHDYQIPDERGSTLTITGLSASDYVTVWTGNLDSELLNPVNCSYEIRDTYWHTLYAFTGNATADYEYWD